MKCVYLWHYSLMKCVWRGCNCKKAYRLSMNGYQREDWLTNIPLYAANVL